MTILAIYARHFQIHRDECPGIDEAITILQYGADAGELYGLAVLDTDENKAWIPEFTPEVRAKEFIGNATIMGKFGSFPEM